MAIFTEVNENQYNDRHRRDNESSSVRSSDRSSQIAATYIWAHHAARSLCDSWATTYTAELLSFLIQPPPIGESSKV